MNEDEAAYKGRVKMLIKEKKRKEKKRGEEKRGRKRVNAKEQGVERQPAGSLGGLCD